MVHLPGRRGLPFRSLAPSTRCQILELVRDASFQVGRSSVCTEVVLQSPCLVLEIRA